jgi:hypothetical protein
MTITAISSIKVKPVVECFTGNLRFMMQLQGGGVAI